MSCETIACLTLLLSVATAVFLDTSQRCPLIVNCFARIPVTVEPGPFYDVEEWRFRSAARYA